MKLNMKIRINVNNKKILDSIKKISLVENRVYLIIAFFTCFWLILIWNMFKYTVINYEFYKWLADNQQIWEVTVPVDRGTILSSSNQWTILSTSLNLYDLAIDPTVEGDINKLEDFLRDLVYTELCDMVSQNTCYNNVLKFLRVLEIEGFVHDKAFIKKLISDRLISKLSQTKVTSVLVDKELDSEQITKIATLWLVWVYPSGNYIYFNPEEISNPESYASTLSPLIWLEEKQLQHLMRKRELKYIPILNKLSIANGEYVKQFINDEWAAYKKWVVERSSRIGSFIILTPKPSRYYPEKEVASQVIGFVSNNGKWHYGIEWYFDDILKWNNGKIVSKKDVLWRIINPIDLDTQDITGRWVVIKTTIDRNIQKRVEQILEKWVKDYKANKGTIVVMEPNTWRVVSIANYPTYDLNNYGDIYELEKVRYSKYPDPAIDLLGMPIYVEDNEFWEKFIYDSKEIYLRRATREELWDGALVKYKYKNDFWPQVYKNDAISSLYEPGSIMKSITVAIWLDTWEIDKNSMYLDEWKLKIDQFEIENVSDKCLWYNSFAHALNYSCNVWMIRIVQKVWMVLMHQYFSDFGFSRKTWIELEWEVTAKLAPWESWSKAQLYTSSYGLWISVTPLQMANAYSILVNGGVYMKPRIVDSIELPDGRTLQYKDEKQKRVLKESTSQMITDWLVSSARDGVANNGNVEGFSVWWKTWTSQIPYKGRYEEWIWSTIGSYAWFGPAEDPKFVIIVKLERPRISEYWWATSAHLFKQVAEYLFDYYEIPKKHIADK